MLLRWLERTGERIDAHDLRLPQARAVAALAQRGKTLYVTLQQCFRHSSMKGTEIVQFDVEVERPQRAVNDIRRHEQILVVFHPEDGLPWIVPVRSDFPDVPHLILHGNNEIALRSICLSAETEAEQKLHWTASRFIAGLRAWLAQTAKGELHGGDQPLEPFMLGGVGPLVLPSDLFEGIVPDRPQLLHIDTVTGDWGKGYIARSREKGHKGDQTSTYAALVLRTQPRPHTVVQFMPKNLQDLQDALTRVAVDVVSVLRTSLRAWATDADKRRVLDAKLIIVVGLPKTRHMWGAIEAEDIYAFTCKNRKVRDIGWDIGAWEIMRAGSRQPLPRHASPEEVRRGILRPLTTDCTLVPLERIALEPLSATFALSAVQAAGANGRTPQPDLQAVLIGGGALGSRVFDHLVRSGFGTWTIIDNDRFLPHNLARHVLAGDALVQPKATALAAMANRSIGGDGLATGLVADLLLPRGKANAVTTALTAADIILDVSASLAVERMLARDCPAKGQRMCAFLSPSGLVAGLLVEDAQRAIRLDALDMQYWRYLIATPSLDIYLHGATAPIRYGRSCRDISGVLPQEAIAVHAALVSNAVHKAVANDEASITLWHVDLDGNTERVVVHPCAVEEFESNGWTICVDQGMIAKAAAWRTHALPCETGGVLVGAIDMQRRIVYVADALPSPPDSVEWPTLYIRGCTGLKAAIERIVRISDGWMEYIGEWHSHPCGGGCSQSATDKVALDQLSRNMAGEGLPALMMIVGDDGQCGWYLQDVSHAEDNAPGT